MATIGECTRSETTAAMKQLMDTFSGADSSYYRFALLVQDLDRQAAAGDVPALTLVDSIHKVARLIKYANKGV